MSGGSSSSKSSTSTSYETNYDVDYEYELVDRRIAAENGSIVAAEGSQVVYTINDLSPRLIERALEEAFGFGTGVTEGALDLSEKSLNAVVAAQDQAFDLTEQVIQETQPQLEGLRNFLTATVLIVGVGALAMWGGRS